MRTHNLGVYVEVRKIIPQLSPNTLFGNSNKLQQCNSVNEYNNQKPGK